MAHPSWVSVPLPSADFYLLHLSFRERIVNMFKYAYENYLQYAYPYDELRPLSCDGIDTWGKFSLTLIDALDTLAVLGNYSEFRRVSEIVTQNIDFDINVNVSVFETNIRGKYKS